MRRPGDIDLFRLDVTRLAGCLVGGRDKQATGIGLDVEFVVQFIDLRHGAGINTIRDFDEDRGSSMRYDATWRDAEDFRRCIGPSAGRVHHYPSRDCSAFGFDPPAIAVITGGDDA